MILDAKKIICYIPCYMPGLFFLFSSLLFQAGLVFSNGQGEKLKNFIINFNWTFFLSGKSKNTKATKKQHSLEAHFGFLFPLVWQRCILIGTLGHASDTASTWLQLLISYYYPFPPSTLLLTTVSSCFLASVSDSAIWLVLFVSPSASFIEPTTACKCRIPISFSGPPIGAIACTLYCGYSRTGEPIRPRQKG